MVRFLGTYRGKIISIAFLGIQIPVFALLCCFCWFSPVFLTEIDLQLNLNLALLFSVTLLVDLVVTMAVLYAIYSLLNPVVLTSDTLNQYLQNKKLDGLDFPDELQNNVENLAVDTKPTLEKLDSIIRHFVNHDSLTGLPNREFFQTYVKQAIAKTQNHQQFALIVLDLNSLKNINSTLGRKVGDLLLNQVAKRLCCCLTENDMLARFGGDEFVILRTNITDPDCSNVLANNLLESLSQSFSLHGKKIHCDVKIGITVYPFDGVTVEQLLQNADTAIYQIKNQELNTYRFYSQDISHKLRRNLSIRENLRYALQRNEFSIYYQPRIEIATSRLVGVEALLRWDNPELGTISPNEFIPIAEETNLIIPIGEWVLRNACLQNKQWQELQLSSLRVSVNLSACQFKQTDLVEMIERVLSDTKLDTKCLELEITESILVEDIERAISILWQLKRKGIAIALDDFGTGYSSLSYLQKLPIDTLKIDRSFVTNLASSPDDIAISKAIIALAQSLELNITAEGVETQAQFEYLQNQGCHEVQGYYFAKPLPGELLQDFLLSYSFNLAKKDSN